MNHKILNFSLQNANLKWYQREKISMKMYCRVHPLEIIRDDLNKKGFSNSKELILKEHNTEVKIAGQVILVHTPPLRSGKRIMFVTLEDEYGLIDIVINPEEQRECAKDVLTKNIVFFKGIVQRFYKHKGVKIKITGQVYIT